MGVLDIINETAAEVLQRGRDQLVADGRRGAARARRDVSGSTGPRTIGRGWRVRWWRALRLALASTGRRPIGRGWAVAASVASTDSLKLQRGRDQLVADGFQD